MDLLIFILRKTKVMIDEILYTYLLCQRRIDWINSKASPSTDVDYHPSVRA